MIRLKKNKYVISGALITILVASILVGIGYVIVGEMAKFVDQLPVNGFTVLDKKQSEDNFWIYHSMIYYFKYGDKPSSWVQVPFSVYIKYNLGDFCNETNLFVFNA